MRVLTALLAGCGLLAFAALAPAQGHSEKKKTNVQVHSKASVKAKTRIKPWRDDMWWQTEHALMKRDLRLTPNQGQRISAINNAASDRIHAAQNSGLRGTALSRRIRLIRADARAQIEKVLSSDQRRSWDWPDWERRWDARWTRPR